MTTPTRRRPAQSVLCIIALWMVGIWGLHHGLAVDDVIARWFFTHPCALPNSRDCWFISKNDAALTFWVHTIPRITAFSIGGGALLVCIAGYWFAALRPHRQATFILVLGLGLTAGIVAALKQVTGHYCPAQLIRYGGVVADIVLAHPSPRCFPAGHPAAGWGLLPLAFAPVSRAWRRVGLWGGVGLGCMLSTIQMMRGEHFFSHNVATALTALCIGGVVYVVTHSRFKL